MTPKKTPVRLLEAIAKAQETTILQLRSEKTILIAKLAAARKRRKARG